MALQQTVNFIPPASAIPYLYLPEVEALFLDRSLRFKQLADGHALADYLRFMASVAMGQHQALAALAAPALPPAVPGQPPLAAGSFAPDPGWHEALRTIIAKSAADAPQAFAQRLRALAAAAPGELDALAQAYLAAEFHADNIALLPVVAAGLQVYWAALTHQLQRAGKLPGQPASATNHCPLCGSLPAGSVVRAGGAHQGLRYLACSLCPTQWHMERIRCVHCGDNAKISYYSVEQQDDAIQAEVCDACHSYTKIMHMEKNPALDVVADDLASVALDMLVGEAGYQRYGLNACLLTVSA